MYYLVDFCCICFNKEHLQHLHASDIDNITYITKLTACVPEMCFNKMNDQRLVCKTCCETLVAAYKFRQKCLRSKTTFIDYVSQLHKVSNISGSANVYLTDISKFNDINKKLSNENDLKIKKEKAKLCNDVDEDTNGKENSEIKFETEINSDNPISLKLTDNKPNCIQFENVFVKIEPEDSNSDGCIDESFDSSWEDKDEINIDFNLMVPEIKIEEDQEERLQESTNNILETFKDKNVDIGTKIEKNHVLDSEICSDEPTLNLDETKIEIVDNDLESMTGEINTQYKSENVDESSKDEVVMEVQGETKTDEDEYSRLKTKGKMEATTTSSEISVIEISGVNDKEDKTMKRNVIIHTDPEAHECKICKKTFNRSEHLNRHMRIHTGKKPLECSVCDKKFNCSSALQRHLEVHTGGAPFNSRICDNKLIYSTSLEGHMRIPSGEKPHEREICNKKFGDSSGLHTTTKTSTKEKPHNCSVCEKKFSNSSNLTKHMRIHTGKILHECNVCKKKFSDLSSLIRHMKTHTGEKPHECNVCNKKFSRAATLIIHKRIHTGEKPYECSVCNRRFSDVSSRIRHLRIHTDEKLPNAVSTTNFGTHSIFDALENSH